MEKQSQNYPTWISNLVAVFIGIVSVPIIFVLTALIVAFPLAPLHLGRIPALESILWWVMTFLAEWGLYRRTVRHAPDMAFPFLLAVSGTLFLCLIGFGFAILLGNMSFAS